MLADRILLKVESLFETQCSDCNDKYQNKLGDTPLLTCILCLQGSHDCDPIRTKTVAMGETKPVGVSWLCFECFAKNNLALDPPQKQQKRERTMSLLSAPESINTILEDSIQQDVEEE